MTSEVCYLQGGLQVWFLGCAAWLGIRRGGHRWLELLKGEMFKMTHQEIIGDWSQIMGGSVGAFLVSMTGDRFKALCGKTKKSPAY